MISLSLSIYIYIALFSLYLDCEIDAWFLVLIHIILQLRLSQLVEGHDDQGHEDVDKEEWEHNKEHDVENGLKNK